MRTRRTTVAELRCGRDGRSGACRTACASRSSRRPAALRLDNGPEFAAQVFDAWCEAHAIEPRFIPAGKPDQNAFIERFNRSYRAEVLDAYVLTGDLTL